MRCPVLAYAYGGICYELDGTDIRVWWYLPTQSLLVPTRMAVPGLAGLRERQFGAQGRIGQQVWGGL
eukprot:3625347-Rhodomonas_salina.5